MATKARRKVVITYSNDIEGEQEINAAVNLTSPGSIQPLVLTNAVGAVLVPIAVDIPAGAKAVTIVKPTDNIANIGFSVSAGTSAASVHLLHPTDPDSISLAGSTRFFLTNTSDELDITVRLFWS